MTNNVTYQVNNMDLIKQINDSLKPKDPVADAIESIKENFANPTQLDDDQVTSIVEYMKEMIDAAKKRGNLMGVNDAAGMALEDVAGFELATKKVMQATIARLARAYTQKYGEI